MRACEHGEVISKRIAYSYGISRRRLVGQSKKAVPIILLLR
jgi:hypothetical protein